VQINKINIVSYILGIITVILIIIIFISFIYTYEKGKKDNKFVVRETQYIDRVVYEPVIPNFVDNCTIITTLDGNYSVICNNVGKIK